MAKNALTRYSSGAHPEADESLNFTLCFINHGPYPVSIMANEYRIKCVVPANYNPADLFEKMPSPIHRKTMSEIYNYRIEKDGFYFVDRAVDSREASEAFRLFVDEALRYGKSVEITKL